MKNEGVDYNNMNTQNLRLWILKRKRKEKRNLVNGAMGLDQWEQGAFQNHNEGLSRLRQAQGALAHVCQGDAVGDAGGQTE